MSSICFPWFNTLSQWKCSSWRSRKSCTEEHQRAARRWLCCSWWGLACVNLLCGSTESFCSNLSTSTEWKSSCLFFFLRRREIWTFWQPGPDEVTALFFLCLFCISKPWIVGAVMSKRMPGPSSPEPPPPAQGKHHGIPRRVEWYNPSSSLAMPWGLLKAGHVSLIFIVFIYSIYLYTIAAL